MVNPANPAGEPRPLALFGVPFHDVTFDETIAWCVAKMKGGIPACLATANVDFLMQATRDPELRRILLDADLVIADGMPIVWASRRMGPPLRERVTGSDLTPLLAAACAREHLRVFLLGGAPGVADKAAAELTRRNPGLTIAGTYAPPRGDLLDMDHETILARLRAARPHLLLVAFGAPKQEKFINLHRRQWEVPLAIGVGGTLDFLAGAQTRAPAWVQRVGFEWLWRMGTDPRRLAGRYIANIAFLARALWRWMRLRWTPAGRPPAADTPDDLSSLTRAPTLGGRFVAVGLGRRDWLDSAALGVLARAARDLRRRDGRLLVYGGAPRVGRLLREAGLEDYLEYCPTREAMDERRARLLDAARRGEVRRDGDRLILRLPAELKVDGLGAWTGRVETVWSAAPPAMVAVDATGLDFLDSAALGWLVALRQRCQEKKIACHYDGFAGAALQTLKLARLDAVLLRPAPTSAPTGAA